MNALQFYNSLTRQKEAFIPREPGKIGMYVCGMTVYDYCHIGHARVMVVFDTIARPPPARERLRAQICAQHHRHRRQNHRPCP